jgi:hypothetical protein
MAVLWIVEKDSLLQVVRVLGVSQWFPRREGV